MPTVLSLVHKIDNWFQITFDRRKFSCKYFMSNIFLANKQLEQCLRHLW